MSSSQAKSNTGRRPFWQMMIETWKNSSMSVGKFCRAKGLSEGTFYGWQNRGLENRHYLQYRGQLQIESYQYFQILPRCSKSGDYVSHR